MAPEKIKMINDILDALAPYPTDQLVEICHRQTPWKNSYVEVKNCEIARKQMKEAFSRRK